MSDFMDELDIGWLSDPIPAAFAFSDLLTGSADAVPGSYRPPPRETRYPMVGRLATAYFQVKGMHSSAPQMGPFQEAQVYEPQFLDQYYDALRAAAAYGWSRFEIFRSIQACVSAVEPKPNGNWGSKVHADLTVPLTPMKEPLPRKIPPKIIALILKHLLADNIIPYIDIPFYKGYGIAVLKPVSLVSREFARQCAPVLYKSMCVQSWYMAEFCLDIRSPHSQIIHHAQNLRITVNSVRSASYVDKMPTQLAHNIKLLHLIYNIHLKVPSMLEENMEHFKTLTGRYATAFANVTTLQLSCYKFTTSRTLLQLLASFPSLTKVILRGVRWERSLPVTYPSDLHNLVDFDCENCTAMWPLILTAAWGHPASDPIAGGFPGLDPSDAKFAAYMCQWTSLGLSEGGRIHIRKTCQQDIYVIMLCLGQSMIEFYATNKLPAPESTSPTSKRPKAARTAAPYRFASICWVVFRDVSIGNIVRDYIPLDLLYDDCMYWVDFCLARLRGLHKIVTEAPTLDDGGLEFVADLEYEGNRTMARHRTWKEAADCARKAVEAAKVWTEGVEMPIEEMMPVSPFWYAEEFEEDRNRLWMDRYINV